MTVLIVNNKKTIIIFSLFIIFLIPLIGHAYKQYQYSKIYVDEYGDLSGYFIINVTNAPTIINVSIPGNVSAYAAFSNNLSLPATLNKNNITVLVENNTAVNITFISFNAVSQRGEAFFLDIDLPSYTDLILPKNSVIIYTNATIQSINGNTISLSPGNIEIEYSIQNVTSPITTTSITNTVTASNSTTLSSTPLPTTSSHASNLMLYVSIIIVIIIAVAVLLLRRSK